MRVDAVKRRQPVTPRVLPASSRRPPSDISSQNDGYSSGKPAEKLGKVYVTWTMIGIVIVVGLALLAVSTVSDLTANRISKPKNEGRRPQKKASVSNVISKTSNLQSIDGRSAGNHKSEAGQAHPFSKDSKVISLAEHRDESMGATYYWFPMSREKVAGIVDSDPIEVIRGQSFTEDDLKHGRDSGINGILDLDELTHGVRLSLCYMLRPMHKVRVQHMIGHRPISENRQWKQGEPDHFFLHPRTDVEINQFNNPDFEKRPLSKSSRLYSSNPVKMGGEWRPQPLSELKCDIPCKKCSRGTCDVDRIRWTMENVAVKEEGNHLSKVITATTWLNSQVPVPYFSYYEFGILTAYIYPKDISINPALSAAFISNCGYVKRNHLVVDFRKYDEPSEHIIVADSYGRCEHNKDEDRVKSRDHTKLSTLANHYYFSLAFENSETIDYISEKFFGSLTSGAVPVYLGAPNCKFYAPDVGDYDKDNLDNVDSIIYTGDYDFDAGKIANVMKDLYRNQSRYLEKLRWKRIGFSGDYQALNELTSTHTACRQCILAGDRNRINHKVFSVDFDSPVFTYVFGRQRGDQNNNQKGGGSSNSKKNIIRDNTRIFYIRERGTYRFFEFVFYTNDKNNPLTFERFVTGVLRVMYRRRIEFNLWKNNQHPNYHRIGPSIYAIYRIPHKSPILNQLSLDQTPNYSELEIIFT